MAKNSNWGGSDRGQGRKAKFAEGSKKISAELMPDEAAQYEKSGSALLTRFLYRQYFGLCLHLDSVRDTKTGQRTCLWCAHPSPEDFTKFINPTENQVDPLDFPPI